MKFRILLLVLIAMLITGADWLGRGSPVDSVTGSVLTVDYAHHEIHSGSSYTTHFSQDVSDTDYRTAITFKTANTTKWGHFVAAVHGTDASIAYIYEAVLIEAGAAGEPAALVIYNRNRNSANTSGFISQHATPVTGGASAWTEAKLDDGNVGDNADWAVTTELEIELQPLGGGTNPVKTIGGSGRGEQEIILKQDTVYMVMIQSSNANDNTHTIHLDWYEHTDR